MQNAKNTVSVASYNIHCSLGTDRRCDTARVARVVASLNADVIGLQEVACHFRAENGLDQLDALARATGYQPVAGPTVYNGHGFFGNALLTRLPVAQVREHDLSIPGREFRGALDVEVLAGDRGLRVIVTHLGLKPFERGLQCGRLAGILADDGGLPVVLMGDLNGWNRQCRSLRNLLACFEKTPAPRSYPSWMPVFRLDRIFALPENSLSEVRTHVTPESRKASDHLPVRGVISLACPESATPPPFSPPRSSPQGAAPPSAPGRCSSAPY